MQIHKSSPVFGFWSSMYIFYLVLFVIGIMYRGAVVIHGSGGVWLGTAREILVTWCSWWLLGPWRLVLVLGGGGDLLRFFMKFFLGNFLGCELPSFLGRWVTLQCITGGAAGAILQSFGNCTLLRAQVIWYYYCTVFADDFWFFFKSVRCFHLVAL